MAIDVKSVLNFSSNNTVSDISPRAVPPSLNTDVEKVSPDQQEKSVSRFEMSGTLNASNTSKPQLTVLNTEQITAAVSKLNNYVEQQQRDIRFSVDKETNKIIVKLLDSNSDVLKQIPSEEVLAILKGIESNKGLFLEYEA